MASLLDALFAIVDACSGWLVATDKDDDRHTLLRLSDSAAAQPERALDDPDRQGTISR
jgi:hypothetical protein